MAGRLHASIQAISVVTVAELKRGAISAGWSAARATALETHLARYLILTFDAEIANAWARLRARCDQLERAKSDNDLWIAATAARYRIPLATLDRDHHDIPGLTLIREDGKEVSVPD